MAKAVTELQYLKSAVALVLGFVGVKMCFEYFEYEIETEVRSRLARSRHLVHVTKACRGFDSSTSIMFSFFLTSQLRRRGEHVAN